MATLTLRTPIQVALFEEELKGQISDGMWENSYPYDHWQIPCCCTVVVGDNPGRDFASKKQSYGFSKLIEYVGDRMIEIAKKAGAPDSYNEKDLRKDLNEIRKAYKNGPRW